MSSVYIESDVVQQSLKWQNENLKVVFTNGCFDLLHAGHISLLNKAAKCGDILVIALNSNESVKRLKGEDRPIESESIRKAALINTNLVSEVYIFDQDTPIRLIELIKPKIIVKGGDYNIEEIVGSKLIKNWNGKVKIIPLVRGFSTTKKIKKLKRQGLV